MSEHLKPIDDYDMDAYEKAKLRALLLGYLIRYADEQLYALDVEREFQIELDVKPFVFVGKIDTLATQTGSERINLEHKTTTTSLEDLSHPYYRKLAFDLQISAYHLAQLLMEEELDQTIYDVVRKPMLRPKKLTKAAITEIESGEYSGIPFKEDYSLELEAGDTESPELFEMRLFADIIANPDNYYLRHGNITRSQQQCVDTFQLLNTVAQDIVNCCKNNAFYQNDKACSNFNTPCEYISLCCGTSDPTSDEWKKREGSSLSGDESLSVSKIACFMECRRKFYWRYVQKIQRNRETPLPLSFGGAFHECLESYWNSTRKDVQDEQSK